MSEQAKSRPDLEIARNILEEAESDAREILEDAEVRAKEEAEKARKEADGVRGDILAKADERGRKLRAREIATANVEAQRILLRAREEAISRVIREIEAELKKLCKDRESYREALVGLAAEAVRAVGGAEVRLTLGPEDRALGDGAFLAAIKAVALERSGRDIVVNLEFAPRDLGGGCIATSLDGRIVYENTFPRRLERMMRQLRLLIVREITKDHG